MGIFEIIGYIIVLILASFGIYLALYGLQYGIIRLQNYLITENLKSQMRKKEKNGKKEKTKTKKK